MRELGRASGAAELKALRGFVSCASRAAGGLGFAPERVLEIELVVEETVTNICKYAGLGRPAEVELACLEGEGLFAVEVSDDGKPFDPTALPAPDLGAPLAAKPIGGLGVHLIRRLCDKVAYRREGDRNVLRLEFRRPAP